MDAPAVSISVGDTSSLDHCEIVSRDSVVQREEEQGEVKFHIIINDGDPIKLRILLELKNIFRKQLPQMPKEYVTRPLKYAPFFRIDSLRSPGTLCASCSTEITRAWPRSSRAESSAASRE